MQGFIVTRAEIAGKLRQIASRVAVRVQIFVSVFGLQDCIHIPPHSSQHEFESQEVDVI